MGSPYADRMPIEFVILVVVTLPSPAHPRFIACPYSKGLLVVSPRVGRDGGAPRWHAV